MPAHSEDRASYIWDALLLNSMLPFKVLVTETLIKVVTQRKQETFIPL